MVRLKHRYLILEFLYPTTPAKPSTSSGEKSTQPFTFQAPTPDTLTPAALVRLLRDAVADLFGDYGAGMVNATLLVKYLSCATSTAIVRVSRAHYRLLWAACSSLTTLSGGRGGGGATAREVVVRVVRVSGTIRKSEEEVIRRAKEAILRARRSGQEIALAGAVRGTGGERGKMRRIVDEDGEGEDEDEDSDIEDHQ